MKTGPRYSIIPAERDEVMAGLRWRIAELEAGLRILADPESYKGEGVPVKVTDIAGALLSGTP